MVALSSRWDEKAAGSAEKRGLQYLRTKGEERRAKRIGTQTGNGTLGEKERSLVQGQYSLIELFEVLVGHVHNGFVHEGV